MVKAFSNFGELEFEVRAYTTKTYGKWILAGEHAVLRGCPAIAFPLLNRALELSYAPNGAAHSVEFGGPNGEELRLLFHGVIENALGRLQAPDPLTGHFKIESALPVGAGLGASAAICGAVAKWCEGQGWVASREVYEFARKLEDLFHGESSGVDLAVSMSAQGIHFVRGGERRPLTPVWWPKLFLSYSGARGMTSDCVNQVKRGFESDAQKAQAIDARMREAVELCEESLLNPQGFDQLKHAIALAGSCFNDWELTSGVLGNHLMELEQAGAEAVKPTGSGGGGYALSLWSDDPPKELKDQLIPIPRP